MIGTRGDLALRLGLLLAPVVVGAVVMAIGGQPVARWGMQLGCGGAAAALALVALRLPRLASLPPTVAASACLAVIAATFLTPGVDGVHRWVGFAGVRLHAGHLVTPALLGWLADERRRGRAPGLLVASALLALQGLHWLQPDAGQASAVALAAIVMAVATPTRVAAWVAAILSLALAAATWWRPDPLQPTPFVEDILARAFAQHLGLGVAALASLLGALLAFAAPWSYCGAASPLARHTLAAYFAAVVGITAIGAFPVPLLGFGAAPVLGLFAGLSIVIRSDRTASEGGVNPNPPSRR